LHDTHQRKSDKPYGLLTV